MPNEAALGAKEEDGFVMGVSPAMDLEEHKKIWKLPYKEYDLIVYTGQGFMYRDILNIRTSDAIVFLRGSVGTLNEFTIGFEEGKVMGILENMGGISGFIDEIIQIAKKETNATVIYDKDPKKLIRRLVQEVQKQKRSKKKRKSIKMIG